MSRIKNILIGLDQFAWVLLTFGGGSPDETISAAAYRLEMDRRWFGKTARPVIDWIALKVFGQEEHCYKSFLVELSRGGLDEIYRNGGV